MGKYFSNAEALSHIMKVSVALKHRKDYSFFIPLDESVGAIQKIELTSKMSL